MKLLGISGSIVGIKTSASVTQFLDIVQESHKNIECELLDLRNFELEFCDGRPPAKYNEDTKAVLNKIAEADCFLIGSPVFQASIPGVLKNLFDLLPPDIFKDKVVGLLVNGGTHKHFLVMENQLRPIVSYFKAYIPPNNVYLHAEDFDTNNKVQDKELVDRLAALGDEIVKMASQLDGK